MYIHFPRLIFSININWECEWVSQWVFVTTFNLWSDLCNINEVCVLHRSNPINSIEWGSSNPSAFSIHFLVPRSKRQTNETMATWLNTKKRMQHCCIFNVHFKPSYSTARNPYRGYHFLSKNQNLSDCATSVWLPFIENANAPSSIS